MKRLTALVLLSLAVLAGCGNEHQHIGRDVHDAGQHIAHTAVLEGARIGALLG